MYNIVWPYTLGGCRLDRSTGRDVLKAGGWSRIELEMPKEEDAWMVLPHVSGRLVK